MYSSSSYFYKNTEQPSETSRCFIFTSAENFDRSVFIQLFVAVILNLLLKCKGVLSNILEHTSVMSPGQIFHSTSPHKPEKHKTSDNKNPPLPTISDDPAPVS